VDAGRLPFCDELGEALAPELDSRPERSWFKAPGRG
jgi:hypothetical protein